MEYRKSILFLRDMKAEKLHNKKVLVRVDFNVPIDKDLQVTDDTRIRAAADTIKFLLASNCIVILMSHLGRPKGKIVDKLRLDSVAKKTGEILKTKVLKLDDCIGKEVKETISKSKPGDIILLENLRFHQEEEKNETGFARELASLADIYVNDAFGTAHRAHASTEGITEYLPSFAGFLMEKEIKSLEKLTTYPDRPFVSIIGGAKVSGKIEILERLFEICDVLLIGGGMAYTFLAAQGNEIGKSILEIDHVEFAKNLIDRAKKIDKEIILPLDTVVADEFKENANSYNVSVNNIEKNMMGMDIGEKTVALFKQKINNAKTIFWNGPLGVFEMVKFSNGTYQIAEQIASLGDDVFSVIGGGDSIAAINKIGLARGISHISTGGGASLEFLAGKILPGLEALKRQKNQQIE
jgi:phosphoglycerate kinase